jgi:cytochrome P450
MAEAVGPSTESFERFNQAMGLGVVADPYPELAELRPLHVVAAGPTLMGEDVPAVVTAVSYDAVQEVLRDAARFSSAGYGDVMGGVMGRTILQMDAPEHGSYRGLLLQAFSRRAMQRWEGEIVRPVVDGLIDAIVAGAAADGGGGELVRQLTFPAPVTVIARLLDLPADQLDLFHRLAVELISVTVDFDRAVEASEELAELLLPLVDRRRVEAGDDLVSVLAQAEQDGQQLTDEEIVSFCRLLLPAGAETTYRSSSNLLVGLLTHPDQLAAVRAERALLPSAIEEALRWEPPLLTILRTATGDTEVCGVAIPAGAVVVLNLGSANRDERYWDEPDRFDILRPSHPILSFGWGAHLCLGMHLARMETRVMVDRLLDRLPGLRLDPEVDPPEITGRTFRSPSEVRVAFDV